MIHRYRPSSQKGENLPENGNVQSYTRSPGAMLHSEDYVQYYLKNGEYIVVISLERELHVCNFCNLSTDCSCALIVTIQ